MSVIHKYIIVGLSIILVFISFRYYSLKDDYTELLIRHKELEGQYAVEKANTSALGNSLKAQNILIENYKASSDEYQKKITYLNEEIQKANTIEVTYESSNNKEASSEEAIQWLRKKASSLVR
jgi:predicted RNase H-like nuclease (RuvC/YqgF family)